MLVGIDFETYYDRAYSLSKLTTEEYIRDPRFEVIGVGIKVGRAPTDWVAGHDAHITARLAQIDWSNATAVAHNAMFDGAILAWHYGIRPRAWVDTLSMARPIFGTTVGASLAKVSTALGIGQKGTEVLSALGKRASDFTAAELAQYGRYCCNDVDLCLEVFKHLRGYYSPNELMLMHETLMMFIDPVLELDTIVLAGHLAHVQESKTRSIAAAIKALFATDPATAQQLVKRRMAGEPAQAIIRGLLMSNQLFATLLTNAGVTPPTKVSPRTGKETYAFAKSDKAFTELLEHHDPSVQALVAARLNVKSTIEETRTERFIQIANRGKFPVPLNYSGAVQTMRWSGADKLNLQNLPRKGALRKAIRAPQGHMIVAVDSSNIELRVNHTLAGQASSVQSFREGRDLYCEFASVLYGRLITKADTAERQLGKLAHLSLGYGCGWKQFQHICRINKVILSDEEAQRIVQLWRNTYAAIPRFWRSADNALSAISAGAEVQVDAAGLIHTCPVGLATPPSHFIRYPELANTGEEGWTYRNRNQRKKIYGGAIVENICQHIARNIIAEQWVQSSAWCRKNAPGWRVVLQVHDELVLCGPEDSADKVLAAVVKLMSASPTWWPHVPLAAEGAMGQTYGDAH